MGEEDAKAMLALPPAQRLIAQRTGVIPDKPAFPGASAPFASGSPPEDKPEPPKRRRSTPKATEDKAAQDKADPKAEE